MPNVPFSTFAYTVTGGSTARTTANRGADAISIKEFGCVGNGVTDDSVAWLSAIGSGLSLFVPPGTYIVGNAVATPLSGQRIYGVPGKSIISKTPSNADYLFPAFDIVDVSDVTIDGLTITLALPPATRQIAIHARVSAGTTSRIEIANCTFNNGLVNIARLVTNVSIHDNKFLGGGATGALNGISTGSDFGTAGVDGLTNKVSIQNNYFTQIRQEAVDINWHTQNVVIDGNIMVDCNIDGTVQEAMDIGGGGASDPANVCKYIVVSNNVIQFTTAAFLGAGIRIKQSTEEVTITGNTLFSAQTGGSSPAIICSGPVARCITISGNAIRGFPYGINTGFSAVAPYTPNSIVISNNVIQDVGIRGISLAGTTTDYVVSNNCISTSVAAGTQNGILVSQCTDFTVTGNRVSGVFATDGIEIAATATDGTVTGNEVSACGAGIKVRGARVTLTGNSVRNCRGIGFDLLAQHLMVVGNQAYNNSQVTADQYGFSLGAGSDYSIVMGNKSYDTQGVRTQNGFIFGASTHVFYSNNIAVPVKTTPQSGTANLTVNSTSLTSAAAGSSGNIIVE